MPGPGLGAGIGPVVYAGRTVGAVNLYASTPDAFDGHHEVLAEICGAWAGGAVTNADLSFTSRLRAAATPDRLRELGAIDIAAGYADDGDADERVSGGG